MNSNHKCQDKKCIYKCIRDWFKNVICIRSLLVKLIIVSVLGFLRLKVIC